MNLFIKQVTYIANSIINSRCTHILINIYTYVFFGIRFKASSQIAYWKKAPHIKLQCGADKKSEVAMEWRSRLHCPMQTINHCCFEPYSRTEMNSESNNIEYDEWKSYYRELMIWITWFTLGISYERKIGGCFNWIIFFHN